MRGEACLVPWLVALGAILLALGTVRVNLSAGAAGVQEAERPKVMVVIDEKVAGIFGTTGWEAVGQAETTLVERLTAAGFPVVDPRTVRANLPRDRALRVLEGDERAAAVTGLQFGAQVVVTGTAISKNAGGKLLGTSMQSLQATVQVKAVRSDDGRVLATRSAQGTRAHIDELAGGVLAIQEASREVADALVTDLQQAWRAASGAITLVITGLVSYRHLAFVQGFLETGVPGVRSVSLRQFAEGTAELGLDYAGRSSRIAQELATRQFTGFRLEPTSVTPGRLDVKAVLEK